MSLFEVKIRDGLARIGEFSLEGTKVGVPDAADVEDIFPELAGKSLSNIPPSAPGDFVRRYFVEFDTIVPVYPGLDLRAHSGDCVLVANWHTAIHNPGHYVQWLITHKRRQPADVMYYLPASALPSNVSFLIYSGFDLFDFRAVDLKTSEELYCTPEGEYSADMWMGSGDCDCPGCAAGDLGLHNRLALRREIFRARQFISRGQLREFVEARCRMNASLVSSLRLLDASYDFIEQYSPVVKKTPMLASSGEALTRPEVQRFAKRVLERFIPTRHDVCVLIPCSAKKPYSLSQSHRKFQNAIASRAHELILTSPLGVVPRELERIYPAAHYDVPVTGYWDHEERYRIGEILFQYLQKHQYRRIIAHVNGDALSIVTEAVDRLGCELECTCRGHPTSKESLQFLENALSGERKLRHDGIRGCCSWQFGINLDSTGMVLKGRAERQVVIDRREQLFSIDPATGMFRPTFAGWDRLGKIYRVYIDDFIPQGDVLAPGIVDADMEIREGDEVFVEGEHVRATGRAAMGAFEMLSSKRGVAIRVRKVQKLA